MELSLNMHDEQFLFGKYIKDGLSRDEADFKIKNLVLHLRKIIADAKQKKKTPEDLHKVFLEELEKFYYS